MVKKRKPSGRSRKLFLFTGIIALSWIIVGISSASTLRRTCKDVVTRFTNTQDNMFLNKDTVELVIRRAHGGSVRHASIGDISVAGIEAALEENPYIKRAEVYTDIASRLLVDVELRKPIARVVCMNGTSFYLDREMNKMKVVSSWVPNVPLVTGIPFEPLTPADKIVSKELKSLRELLLFIDADKFFRAQVSILHLESNGEVVMEPEIGNTEVLFGKPENVEEKFENLRAFYHQVFTKTDYNYYKSISLKFKNQVVAKKRS